MGPQLAGQASLLRLLEIVILLPTAAISYGLLEKAADDPSNEALPRIPVLRLLGSRTNAVASVLDVAQAQLGIDLRSTWAFTVVRRSVEPLAIGLCLVGWLTTSLTVINPAEEGLVETLGVPRAGAPLAPGLHLHWPWPIDRVIRIPAKRMQTLTVGHEGEGEGGPEDVLWARAHALNEYTLLLGDGRDLITVDAAVQFRIADARAWHYNSQNPADALRAVAYRAVMRATVNRTLSDALSENLVRLTGRMRAMVQDDADRLGLGVEVVAFTVGGMHPPVSVAPDYQAVVSAELRKVTDIVLAEAYRNQTLPQAESAGTLMVNTVRGDGLTALGRGAGEAWSFRALESEYRAAPSEYVFRRRLETLERGLAGRRYTVVDSRVQRDGGELWMTR
jgi:membrane protease subunit HflK